MATAANQTRYRVEGMDCPSCAEKIDTALRRVPGVEDVSVSVMAGTMTLSHTDESDLAVVEKKVRGLGFDITPLPAKNPAIARDVSERGNDAGHAPEEAHEAGQAAAHTKHDAAHEAEAVAGLHGHDHGPTRGRWWTSTKGLLTIASGLALVAAYGFGKAVPGIEVWAFDVAMLVGLVPIARRAIVAARYGTPFSIEMLMTIAAVGAVIIGAGEEGAAVVFLFLVGELLEGVAAGQARASIQALTQLVPKTARVERAGKTEEVPAESLAVGATILVRPGDRVPADGVIISGESAIDEAPVTGESTPVRKGVDANIFAGTVNGDSALRVRVTAAAADNTIARVVKLVEEAQESKAPTERFIDQFSRYYTPGVVLIAALVAVMPPLLLGGSWNDWIYKGLAILLIGCPCAFVISTPAAIAASLSAGARRACCLRAAQSWKISAKSRLPPSIRPAH